MKTIQALVLLLCMSLLSKAQMTYHIEIPIDTVKMGKKTFEFTIDTKSDKDSILNYESKDYFSFKGKLLNPDGKMKFSYTDYEYKIIIEGNFEKANYVKTDTVTVETAKGTQKKVLTKSISPILNGMLVFKRLEGGTLFRKRYFKDGVEIDQPKKIVVVENQKKK
jgi:hypothetical protein